MRRFWSFYQNESYQVGCSGRTVYIYDKAGNELAKFRDIPYAYTAAFMPGKNIIAVKSTEGRLGFYDLDSLCLLKRITITRIGAQDEGFCFSPDGSFFYNIEKPITSLRTQLGVYETNTFTKVSTLFAEDVRTVLRHLEFDEKTGTCYLLGYVRNDMGVRDRDFIAIFNTESQALQDIHFISQKQYDYLAIYKHWELSGFTEKALEWSFCDRDEKLSLKEVYEAAGS